MRQVTLKENRTEWKVMLNSEAGAKLVEWLLDNYDGETLAHPENTHQTYYRLGQRDVARFLKNIKEKELNG